MILWWYYGVFMVINDDIKGIQKLSKISIVFDDLGS